jgi:hypothetical protein
MIQKLQNVHFNYILLKKLNFTKKKADLWFSGSHQMNIYRITSLGSHGPFKLNNEILGAI